MLCMVVLGRHARLGMMLGDLVSLSGVWCIARFPECREWVGSACLARLRAGTGSRRPRVCVPYAVFSEVHIQLRTPPTAVEEFLFAIVLVRTLGGVNDYHGRRPTWPDGLRYIY